MYGHTMAMKYTAPSGVPDDIYDEERGRTQPEQDDIKDRPSEEVAEHTTQHQAGVSKIEGFNKALYRSGFSGKLLLGILCCSVWLTMFGYALDQGITTQFTAIATSSFLAHADLGAVNTASTIVRAISKPFLGKLSDVSSRPTVYSLILVFYIVGFIIAASCTSVASYAVGICFTAFGKSGLDLMSDIIVGDLTPLQWRGFFGSLMSVPFLVTTFINAEIAERMIPDKWRWGLGMFTIIIPAVLIPAIITLYALQRRAAKMGMVGIAASGGERKGAGAELHTRRDWYQSFLRGLREIDFVGLILLGFGFALLLLPFNLYAGAKGKWANPSMIAMLIVGIVILLLFGVWEMWGASVPLMNREVLVNRAFLAAVVIDVFKQMASSVNYVYFPSYIWIIKDWSNYAWNIFLNAVTLGLCFWGPIAGLIQAKTHRFKSLSVFGEVAAVIGYGLMIKPGPISATATSSLIAHQVLLGLGSFTVVGVRVASQASVRHENLASLIALLSLWSTIGSAIGSSIVAAIWTGNMEKNLRKMVPPETSDATVAKLYGSIKILKDYDWNDPVRIGAIKAYQQTNGIIYSVTLGLALIAMIAVFFLPNYYLGAQQNAVTNIGLDGKHIEVPDEYKQKPQAKGLWGRIMYLYNKN